MARPDLVYADTPGLYACRLVKGGVEVAVEVAYGPTHDPLTGEELDRSWYWTVRFQGENPPTYCSPAPYPRLLLGRRISCGDYDYLVADRSWARDHAPHLPEAQPHKRVEISTLPIPF